MMKVAIDQDGCIGCGLCVGMCPEVFGMADNGLAEVIASPTQATIDSAKEAAEGCPVTVITMEE